MRLNVINNRITGIDDSITRMEERLALREKQYSQQLYQMQGLLNDLVLQGNQITTMTNTINNNMSLF